ncbi:similar to Saccharomyces cerevisiae YDL164C CDC9 DNA ligase found in the nucleus and mitochondria, an essential enzyme that joins Okazaki fragments during DNA replication [Maudiozyma saulgeensis]|uniref:DNA ligase n=1 Tax=Maudiozyma saulgeensis TaxID=1789683 RepID=A0A1X7QYK0_9SACH|nr:similar to Saccharomyces cerevisiae YDL164C CDC9 DNA ligase found in the nucleus and mitochondria, an essential enzyme that joins Okazaki fragments during DNA replication [Kazachstania saulgeensis]
MFRLTIQTFSIQHRSSLHRILFQNNNILPSSIKSPIKNIIMSNNGKKQATLARFFTSIKKSEKPTLDKQVNQEPIEKSNARVSETTNNSPVKKPKIEITPESQPIVSQENKKPDGPFVSKVPYNELCNLFEEIEKTSSRLSIIKLCSDFLIKIMKEDKRNLIPVTYLCINKLGPDYLPGMELGLGEGLLMKTISEACGKSLAQVKLEYKDTGDLGQVAMTARSIQPTMFKPKPLTVGEVFQNLKLIASSQGKDSQTRKMKLIKRMLTACEGVEAKFLIRSLESKLRIGLAEKSVLISLSKALLVNEYDQNKNIDTELIETAEQKIRDAFCQVPNYEIIINSCLEHGIMELETHCSLRPGIPLKPMLAKPTKAITEVLDTFQGQHFTSEYKYDGERAQVHLMPDGTMRIYSRNGENMTERYPEINIHDFIKDTNETKTLILDCEAVAWDKEQEKILPFQVLSTRKRKGVDIKDIKVRVCLFAFDILCLNDAKLINHTLRERRDILQTVTKVVPGEFQYATELTTNNVEELQKFLDDSVNHSCEGLMVKMLDGVESHYEPSKRSRNWLKLKKDYLDGVGDSLDLCVLGAFYGKGKRTGKYGGFLLGCYNQDTGEFETACKIGTGFSDELLQQLYDRLSPTVIDGPKATYVFDPSAEPDVWFEPTVLFEVLTADLSLSPIYKAGSATYDRGISLRFPRFIRLRDDKGSEDATSSEQVIEFYESQSHIQN